MHTLDQTIRQTTIDTAMVLAAEANRIAEMYNRAANAYRYAARAAATVPDPEWYLALAGHITMEANTTATSSHLARIPS